jgi:hypothetical protein
LEPPKSKKAGSADNSGIAVPKVSYSSINASNPYNFVDENAKLAKLESNGKLTLDEN